MLRVSVDKLQPGMVLARPVPLPAEPHRYLLQRDIEIRPDMQRRLKQLGIVEVWVRCRDLEFLENVIDEELCEQQRQLYCQVRKNFEQVMRNAVVEIDISHFQTSISSLFDFLKSSNFGRVMLEKLDAFDNYLMSHSTNVCYVALLVGMKLERYLIQERSLLKPKDAKDLRHLGLGCLLHDIGKMRIPPEILNKPGKLSPEEYETMKKHPTIGYDMLRGQAPPAAAQVVLHHHQRWDGKGYPVRTDSAGQPMEPMRGRQVPIFCRIATMADIYDAATSQRVYSPAKPSVQVLHEMRTWCQGAFDPIVEQAFYEVIPPFPIGQIVKLSNGIEAAVVDFNPRFPVSPKVQCLRTPSGERFEDPSLEEIDLSHYPEMEIVSVDGVDVRPYLDTQRARPIHTLDPMLV
ncbi:MAG: HD-GYP domain-containing protein [Planctomycetales bacterium]|nr:HD-GYP domain-containing protein [Planctomycetales bacterium]